MKISELKDKKILILGFGREGKDTFLFLKKMFPKKALAVADRKKIKKPSRETKVFFGKSYLQAGKKYDIVIKAPGIPYKSLPQSIVPKIITQTDLFFDNCPGRIIGVTGTKGKSTTSSLIYAILKKAGIQAHLVGNIGKPVLSSLLKAGKKDVFVCELSSHQLYNAKKSPNIAVLLNIYEEHLDYYKSFKDYVNAKANIAKHQTKGDFIVYNSRNKLVKRIAEKSRARKIKFQGKYYSENIEAAKKVAAVFKIPRKTVSAAIEEFKFLPHRLEYAGNFKGIKFYNDSLATIPGATIGALHYLGKNVQTLIAGGFDRKINYSKLGQEINKSGVKFLILFPTTGQRILKEVLKERKKPIKHFFVKNMKEAVRLAYQNTDKGKICLLSPASASFNLFLNYEERGNLFKKFVKMLK